MFVKATNGQIDQYPYTVGDLRRDNPNTSFPKHVPETTMAAFGMFPVGYEAAPDYDPMTHRIEHSNMPVLKDGKWVLTKTVVPLTAEQIADRLAQRQAQVDEQRRAAYQTESDPLFFKWQRGESTEQEWKDAVAAIQARFPDPA